MISFDITRLAMLAALLVCGDTTLILAQTTQREVTVIALDSPSEHSARIFVRAEGRDKEVIALGPQALADDLAQALRLLAHLKSNPTAAPTGNFMITVRSERIARAPGRVAENVDKLPGEYMATLRKASRRNVQGFGSVRALRIAVTDG